METEFEKSKKLKPEVARIRANANQNNTFNPPYSMKLISRNNFLDKFYDLSFLQSLQTPLSVLFVLLRKYTCKYI